MQTNIINLSQVNHALAIASVNAAQLAELGFQPLDNKAICEGLPPEQTRQLRNAKLYPADSVPRIRQALATRLAQPITTAAAPGFERKRADDTEGGDLD
ncbi:hypothetical protein [Comamonas sp. GB3 AK4-5]|uniref:hypothetical protein n=1 Tax=Comamonas sp. GB3 AK4-5 TaxID=3231487 RepID=UPI00351F1747